MCDEVVEYFEFEKSYQKICERSLYAFQKVRYLIGKEGNIIDNDYLMELLSVHYIFLAIFFFSIKTRNSKLEIRYHHAKKQW